MHRNLVLVLAIVAFVLATALSWAGPGLNDVAPDVRYMDLDGNEVTLYEQYGGSILVLELLTTG